MGKVVLPTRVFASPAGTARAGASERAKVVLPQSLPQHASAMHWHVVKLCIDLMYSCCVRVRAFSLSLCAEAYFRHRIFFSIHQPLIDVQLYSTGACTYLPI